MPKPPFLNHDLDQFEKECLERGIKPAAADHPIYSEGSSITFLSHTQEPPAPKGIALTRKHAPTSTD